MWWEHLWNDSKINTSTWGCQNWKLLNSTNSTFKAMICHFGTYSYVYCWWDDQYDPRVCVWNMMLHKLVGLACTKAGEGKKKNKNVHESRGTPSAHVIHLWGLSSQRRSRCESCRHLVSDGAPGLNVVGCVWRCKLGPQVFDLDTHRFAYSYLTTVNLPHDAAQNCTLKSEFLKKKIIKLLF